MGEILKIIPHAANNITLELENGDRYEIITDYDHLDIRVKGGDMTVHKYDLKAMQWNTSSLEHNIRLTQ